LAIFSSVSKSECTINLANSFKLILGSQPSCFFALEGSPNKQGTSCGRKNFSSITTC